jgi:hypothetical protein
MKPGNAKPSTRRHEGTLIALKIDPNLEALRQDPRYRRLLASAGPSALHSLASRTFPSIRVFAAESV